MKGTILATFAAFTVWSMAATVAKAQEQLTYNYLQGGIAVYPSFNGQDFVGAAGRGAYALTDDVFLFGGVTFLTDDIDLTAVHGGVGYRIPVSTDMDIYAGATLEYQDIEATAFVLVNGDVEEVTITDDDTALGFRGGVRYRLDTNLEFGGELRVVTGDFDYIGASGYVQYLLNPQLGLIGEIDLYDGELGLVGGIRYNFGE